MRRRGTYSVHTLYISCGSPHRCCPTARCCPPRNAKPCAVSLHPRLALFIWHAISYFHLQPPCRRCQLSGTVCVFEKPDKKPPNAAPAQSLELVSSLHAPTPSNPLCLLTIPF